MSADPSPTGDGRDVPRSEDVPAEPSVRPAASVLPSGSADLRTANTALVLRTLRAGGPAGRAQLAQRTGLAKATVGSIVAELTTLGAVVDTEPAPPAAGRGRGRPAAPIRLADGGLVGVGVEVNVDYVAAIALDLAGRVVDEQERALDGPPDVTAVGDELAGFTERLAAAGHRVLGTEVAVPGLIDAASGHVADAPNLGWSDLPLAELLTARLGSAAATPVRLDNDANCAAVAESLHGAAAGADDLVYLTGTVGIGAGVISRGALLRGTRGFAGEIGHLPLGEPGRRCRCGRDGCWEATVGLDAVVAAAGLDPAALVGLDPLEAGRRLAEELDTAPDSADAAGRITPVAERLADGCLLLAGLYDPAVIVLGGFFAPLGDRLVPVVEQRLEARLFAQPPCRVITSTLGIRAAAWGAATAVLSEVYEGRLPLAG